MAKRTYGQYCAVARGLDVIGERWTMLLVRELLLGPKRYGDLLAAATGIGTNLLADRLRDMEAGGLVERVTLPPPAGSAVYRLTEAGRALEPVMLALGRWGARYMALPRGDDRLAPGAYFVALRARFRPDLAEKVSEAYEFRVDGRVFEVRVERGGCVTSEGQASAPVATFAMDADTLNDLFFGTVSADEALAAGRVVVAGDPTALARFQSLFPSPFTSTTAQPRA
ncbi:MAG TPA: winged helix-turn-helix transcriptional regulator [Candidatus Dormibacteraeota bacterium]